MRMGEQNLFNGDVMPGDLGQDSLKITTGIYYRAHVRGAVPQDAAVLLKGRNRDYRYPQ
jgi:hypothetical protein